MKKLKSLLILGISAFFLTGCLSTGFLDNNGNKENGDNYFGDGGNSEESPNGNNNGGSPDNGGDQNGNSNTPTDNYNVVSFTVEELAGLYGWEDETQYSSFFLDSAIEVLSAGRGNNTGKYYVTDQTYRLYGSETSTLQIAAKEGKTIKSVTITYTPKNNGELVGLTSGQEKEINGSTATFMVSESGQARITAITVKYDGAKGVVQYPTNWKASELTVLEQHLYGVEVPFIYFPGIYLTYDDDYGVYAYAENATLDMVAQYAQAFDENEYWANVDETLHDNDLYFMATVETTDGDRYVIANLYLVDDDGYLIEDATETGYLNIDLYDPYYYEWNNELFESIYSALKTESSIPEVDNISFFAVQPNEEYTAFTLSFFELESSALGTYKAKLTGFDLEDIDTTSFKGVSKDQDLEIKVSYIAEEEVLEIQLIKHLAPLDEFPLDAIKAYNGGYEVPAPEGADYFTAEVGTEPYEGYIYETGTYDVVAYGIDSSEYAIYTDLLADEDWKSVKEQVFDWETYEYVDGDGFVATKVINGRLYSFVYTFNAADETLSFRYDQEPTSYVFTAWFADFINTEFLTEKSLTTAIPELPLDGAEQYVVDLTLDDFFSYDNVQIVISGDHSTAWATALTGGNYVVETDENGDTYYLSADGKIAIYSDYDEDSDSTYAIIYATADFEE